MLLAGAAAARSIRNVTMNWIRNTSVEKSWTLPAKPPVERGKRGEFHLSQFSRFQFCFDPFRSDDGHCPKNGMTLP
jgi:hypothetical protein